MSGGGKKQKQKGVQQQMVDPNVYGALYGQGATQPRYGKSGQVLNQDAVEAGRAAGQASGGGLLGSAQNLSQQPALNQTQTAALGGMSNYLTSPEALSGQQAMQQSSNYLMGQIPGGESAPQGVDWNAIRAAAQADLAKYQNQGNQIDYAPAVNHALSGQADNPQLANMAQGAADLATQNWLRSVAPQLRGDARMSGMYGGSRQGIAEGIAAGDLNRAVLNNTANMYGIAYENAQQRQAAMGGQMAGLDRARQQALMQYDLGSQGIGINAGQLGLANRQLTSQNAVQGAALAQNASQIPYATLQQLYGVGSTVQAAPWQNLLNYANLLYPQAQLGQAQTTNSQTTQSGGNGLMGLATMGMGMLGGMGGGAAGAAGGASPEAIKLSQPFYMMGA